MHALGWVVCYKCAVLVKENRAAIILVNIGDTVKPARKTISNGLKVAPSATADPAKA